MRRILWNTYAWPITVFVLLGFLLELGKVKMLPALDVAFSIPALLALHLHVWDVKLLSSTFWRFYAFAYFAWDLYYNLVLNPMQMGGGGFKPELLILPAIALPLYVAIFRYAFRNWSAQRV
jgi:hypothetical protein